MIAFADIEEIYRLECKEPMLQKIDEDFYIKFIAAIENIEEKHRAYALKILEKIYDEREKKIIFHALRAQKGNIGKPINIIKAEEDLYFNVVKILKSNREKFFSVKERDKGNKKNEFKMSRVKFINSIPAFICLDLKKYGPFNEGDISEIVEENAKILAKNKFVEILNK